MSTEDSGIMCRNRETGELERERVFGGGALEFLYRTTPGRLLTSLVLKRSAANRLYGWLQRTRSSRKRIPAFVESLGIDATLADRPLDEYLSLDEFFCRRLRPCARPIDRTPLHLVAPADGRALVYPDLDGCTLTVKGSRVTLATLLGDASRALPFKGGSAIVVRLAPADYHRFHFPETGSASAPREIPGPLHSVHAIALAGGAPSFENKRVVSRLETDAFGTLTMVEVGALCVGTIVETYAPGQVARGDEKGFFRFGGSTVILLAAPHTLTFDHDLVQASAQGIESLVRMGTRIGRAVGAAPRP